MTIYNCLGFQSSILNRKSSIQFSPLDILSSERYYFLMQTMSILDDLSKTFPEPQARSIVRALEEFEAEKQHITKEQLDTSQKLQTAEMNAALKAQTAELNASMKKMGGDLALSIKNVEADMKKMEADLTLSIKNVEADLTLSIKNVETGLALSIKNVEAGLALSIKKVEGDMKEMEIRLIKWVIGLMIAQTSITIAVLKMIGN